MSFSFPTTDFTLAYSCGHRRVFRVEEITSKTYEEESAVKAQDNADTSEEVTSSPSPCSEVDLGTVKVDKEAASTAVGEVDLETMRVKWEPEAVSSRSSVSSSSISSKDPMYFHPSKMGMRVFDRDEECPSCAPADTNKVSGGKGGEGIKEGWELLDEVDEASEAKVLSDWEQNDKETEEAASGWWDVLDIEEYWAGESDWECESDRDVDDEVMEALEMV